MNRPIVLYNENHVRVGETYHRRAKQLVRSGRAVWLEEGHSLQVIPYQTPGMPAPPPFKEELPIMERIYTNNGIAPETTAEAPHPAAPNELRMYLARQNVARKKNLIRNIVAYVLAWVVCLGLMHTTAVVRRPMHSASVAVSEPFAQQIPQSFQFRQNRLEFCPYTVESMLEAYIIENVFERIDNVFENFSARGWMYPNYRINDVVSFYAPRFNTVQLAPTAQHVTAFSSSNMTSRSNSNPWSFVVGVMFAWGVWILARGISISRQQLQSRPKRSFRPDPVSMEYQRLSSMDDHI